MAEEKVHFDLVSPQRLLLTEEADMVVIPGGEGDFGVLAGHAPMLSTVRPGIVDIYENDRVTKKIFIAGGFAEVTSERCTVLAEEAVEVSEIDRSAAEERLSNANQALGAADEGTIEHKEAEKEVRTAEAMLAAVEAS